MSQFTTEIVRVQIEPHPNADAIELAHVGGYISIVKKGQFKSGDFAIYLPEQSVLPEWLLKHLGFWDELNNKGLLNGSAGNRIKAVRLRGIFSQGILLDMLGHVTKSDEPGREHEDIFFIPDMQDGRYSDFAYEGDDVSGIIGVTKYEPIVPAHMAGRAVGGDLDSTIAYDFENLKKIPTLFDDGEDVVMTEKIHGTFVQVGLIPEAVFSDKSWAEKVESIVLDGVSFKPVVTSKGQGAKGILLDTTDEHNLYVKTAAELGLWEKLHAMRKSIGVPADKPIFLCGEIFGPGVQVNFAYGQTKPVFKAFDIYIGTRSEGFFVDYGVMRTQCEDTGVETVPLLYKGPFSQEVLNFHTNGKTHIRGSSGEPHIREGLVVKTARETKHRRHGRKIAKSVSEQYLLKGKTTEFQ